jgi:hypothetical protein
MAIGKKPLMKLFSRNCLVWMTISGQIEGRGSPYQLLDE